MSNSKQNDCTKKPCQSRNSKENLAANDDPNSDIYNRPLLYAGVLWIGLVKNILIPSSCRRSSSTSLLPASDDEDPPIDVAHSHTAPVNNDHGDEYDRDHDHGRQRTMVRPQPTSASETPTSSKMEGGASGNGQTATYSALADIVRDMQQQMKRLSDETSAVLRNSQDITADALVRLRSEEESAARYAAVAGSGLVGYMMGLRRGSGVRLIYAATGAMAAATLCYPRNALEYDLTAMELLEKVVLSGVASIRESFRKFPQEPQRDSDTMIIDRGVHPKAADHHMGQMHGKQHVDDDASRSSQRPPFHHPSSPDPRRRELPPAALPYSPALPAPPKTTWDLREESQPLPPVQETKEGSGVIEKYFADDNMEVYIRVITDTEHESGSDNEDSEEETTTEEGPRNHHYPLNKKLSQYYQSKEDDESISYLDKGNEDLYSKRR